MIPGLIAAAFVAVLSVIYIEKLIQKELAKGAHWVEAEDQPAVESGKKGPHFIVAILPLVAVIVCYNAIGWPAYASLVVGIILGVILFFPYLEIPENYEGGKSFGKMTSIMNTFNEGTGNAGIPCVMLISFGLASCIQASNGYMIISDFFVGLSLPAAISLALVSTVPVGASCGPAGLMIATMLAANTFIPEGMIAAGAAFRILVTTATVFDTLPCFPGPATIMMLTGVKQKDGYPPVGMTTVLFTAIAVAIVVVLYILFPGIA